MRLFVAALLVILTAALFLPPTGTASAATLRVEPLQYRETLREGERKRGFIDVSNPSGQDVKLVARVQGFRQTDDKGSLEFYDDTQLREGIRLDLKEFELGAQETLRLFFEADASKLPQGDVFAAIFVSTAAGQESAGIAQSVRLGTLLSLVNGTPGSRDATIERLDIPLLQLGDGITGSYTIRNVAQAGGVSGFYPEVILSVSPFETRATVTSPLVQAGIERQVPFAIDSPRFGLYKVRASYGDSSQERWVLAVTGPWKGALVAGLLALLVSAFAIGRAVRHWRYYKPHKGL